jgi:hypothetical protein
MDVLADADRDLDAVEADLLFARGRLMHARFLAGRVADAQELVLFERAAELYREVGDERGESEALFLVATVHQVIRQDDATAVPLLERARELAISSGDRLTLSYVLRHLGTAEHSAGRLTSAREFLEESTRLRREVGFLPGVAANLVGLAHVAVAEGRPDDARALVDEAAAICETSGARGIQRWVDDARAVVEEAKPQ